MSLLQFAIAQAVEVVKATDALEDAGLSLSEKASRLEVLEKLEAKLGRTWDRLSGDNQVKLWGELKTRNMEHVVDGY